LAEYFEIAKRNHITENIKTKTRNDLKKKFEIELTTNINLIEIRFTDYDKKFAYEVLKKTVELLEKQFYVYTENDSKEKITFIEERIISVSQELSDIRKQIIEFQNKYGIIDIASESKAVISQIASLKTELIKKQAQRKAALAYLEPNDPSIAMIDKEILSMQKLISDLNLGQDTNFIAANNITSLVVQAKNMQTDEAILENTLIMLKSQLETEKITGKANLGVFQVIEEAEVPEIKSRPSRLILVVLVAFIMLFLMTTIAGIRSYIAELLNEEDNGSKIKEIVKKVKVKKVYK
jgi:capsule polysaccharide export protein KpsE/RkpR